jgi:predicted  nucleic acid-binding Zn-ribbon protein
MVQRDRVGVSPGVHPGHGRRVAADGMRVGEAVSDPTNPLGYKSNSLSTPTPIADRIRAALKISGNRWSEWGTRAEAVCDALEPIPDAVAALECELASCRAANVRLQGALVADPMDQSNRIEELELEVSAAHERANSCDRAAAEMLRQRDVTEEQLMLAVRELAELRERCAVLAASKLRHESVAALEAENAALREKVAARNRLDAAVDAAFDAAMGKP